MAKPGKTRKAAKAANAGKGSPAAEADAPIKRSGSKVFAWILISMLIVGLAGFGIGNFGGSSQIVGSVGDEEISVGEYARGLTNRLQEFQSTTGQQLTVSQARAFGLDRLVLEQLMNTAALDNEARRIGISVGDAEVQRRLLDIASFRGPDGKFDQTAYEFALDRVGFSPARFDDELRAEATRLILRDAITEGVIPGDTFASTLAAFIAEKRSFRWAEIDAGQLETATRAPSEEEIATYYNDHPEPFTAPETRRITYAWLTPEMMAATIEISDADLRSLYEAHAGDYTRPERRLVERLVFADTAAAEAAYAAINAGEQDFNDLIAARGLSLDDVDLGEVARDDLGAEAAGAVFGMIGPGLTPPVQSSLGPAIFRVNALLSSTSVSFEAARDDLSAELLDERARRAIGDSIEGIDDRLAGGATLEELADETEMQLGQIDFTDQSEGGIAGYDAFREAATKAAPGDFPEIADLSDGGIFALRLDELVAPRLRPLIEVHGAVVEAWRAAETQRRLAQKAAQLVTRLTDATGPDTATTDTTTATDTASDATGTATDTSATATATGMDAFGLDVHMETALSRDAFIDAAPPALLEKVFALEPGQPAVIEDEGKVFLVQLTEIIPADPNDEDTAAMSAQFTSLQGTGIADDIFVHFATAAQIKAGMTINQAAINAVHAQFP